tara:strand:- start:1365 stop:5081 length:3717 start_codon:yes stop_codon:yes gene_type:complete
MTNRYLKHLSDDEKEQYTALKQAEAVKPLKDDLPKLTQNDLRESPEALETIRAYMDERFGIDEISNYTDDELVSAYVNNMRRFHAGQSVATLGEVSWLHKADPDSKTVAGNAYALFDRMENIFTGKRSTFLERLDGVYDYARAAVVDPTNLIGFGAGRLVATVGTKSAATLAKKLAIDAAQKGIMKKAKGKITAKEALDKATTKVLKEKSERQFYKEAMKTFAESESKRKIIGKEVGAALGTDMALAMGVDYAYQQGMITADRQESYSTFQTGLTAMGGLIAPAFTVATKAVRGKTAKIGRLEVEAPEVGFGQKLKEDQKKNIKKHLTGVTKELDDFWRLYANDGVPSLTTKEAATLGEAQLKATGFKTLTPDETSFWKIFVKGSDDLNVRGLAQALYESGARWYGPRFEGDSFTNWMGDVIRNMPKEEMGEFIAKIKSVTKNIPEYDKALKKYRDDVLEVSENHSLTDEETMNFFANMFVQHYSDAGRRSQVMSFAAQTLSANEKIATTTKALLEANLDPISDATRKTIETTNYIQRSVIRNLVTNPGTTALNIIGWYGYSSLQSFTDLTHSALYGGGGFLKKLVGNEESSKELFRKAKALRGLQLKKVRNTLDPVTTQEAFLDYLDARPDVAKKMMQYLAGGIETEDVLKKAGFDPAQDVFKGGLEKYTDFFQTIYGTKAQDIVTKSIEFMYNIEKGLQLKYGMTYKELVNSGKIDDMLSTNDFLKIESKAIDDTLKSVFGKKYGKLDFKNPVRLVAYGIEEFRKIPVVGLSLPFGQFFNNTVAFMADYSGVNVASSVWNRKDYFSTNKKLRKLFLDSAEEKAEKARASAIRKGERTDPDSNTGKYISELTSEDKIQQYISENNTIKYTEGDLTQSMIKMAIGWSYVWMKSFQEEKNIEEGLAWDQERDADFIGGKGAALTTKQYDYPESLFKYGARIMAHKRRGEEIPTETGRVFWDVFGLGQFDRSLGTYERGIGNIILGIVTGELDSFISDSAPTIWGEAYSTVGAGMTRPLDPINQMIALSQGENYVNVDRRQGNKYFNRSIRYVDAIFNSMLDKPEKASATSDIRKGAGTTKVLGYREVPKQSYTERMFNVIGKPNWRVGFFGDIPEADARLNQRLFYYLEDAAKTAFLKKGFKDMSTAQKETFVKDLLMRAKRKTKESLKNSLLVSDKSLEKMYSLDKKYNDKVLRKALKDLGYDKDLDDLNFEELEMLDSYISSNTQYTKRKSKSIMEY